MRIRQRTQQHGVYHTKNGGVSANTERESEYGDSGESRLLRQHSESIPKILKNCAHVLFAAQRNHGIDSAGATRRDPGSQQCGGAKDQTNSEIDSGIEALCFEQDTLQGT